MNSIVPYYVLDPFRMSLRGDATPRHGRPYYEFSEAKYYGHTVVDVQQVNYPAWTPTNHACIIFLPRCRLRRDRVEGPTSTICSP